MAAKYIKECFVLLFVTFPTIEIFPKMKNLRLQDSCCITRLSNHILGKNVKEVKGQVASPRKAMPFFDENFSMWFLAVIRWSQPCTLVVSGCKGVYTIKCFGLRIFVVEEGKGR